MADLLFSWVANILISIPDTNFTEFYPEEKVPYTLKIFTSCHGYLKHQNGSHHIIKYVMIALVASISEEMSFEPICLEGFSCQVEAGEIKKNNLLALISYSKL